MPEWMSVVGDIEVAIEQLERGPVLSADDCAVIAQLDKQLRNMEQQLVGHNLGTSTGEAAALRSLGERLHRLRRAKSKRPVSALLAGIFRWTGDERQADDEKEMMQTVRRTDHAASASVRLAQARREAVLDEMAANIQESKLIAQRISDELDAHFDIVDDLDRRTDEASARMQHSTSRVVDLRKRARSNTCCAVTTIVCLIGLLVLIISLSLL